MTAQVRVVSRTDNVAGVKLPVFSQYDTGAEQPENLGLVGGGRKIQACRDRFGDYLKALIKLASLQTSFLAMDEALKITNRRVNALENVTLPKITSVIDYINRYVHLPSFRHVLSEISHTFHLELPYRFTFISVIIYCRELDELEREDFTRLKMVKKKKEEAIKEAEKTKEENLLIQAEAGLDMKKLKVDDSKSTTYTDYDAIDDSDIVFK